MNNVEELRKVYRDVTNYDIDKKVEINLIMQLLDDYKAELGKELFDIPRYQIRNDLQNNKLEELRNLTDQIIELLNIGISSKEACEFADKVVEEFKDLKLQHGEDKAREIIKEKYVSKEDE